MIKPGPPRKALFPLKELVSSQRPHFPGLSQWQSSLNMKLEAGNHTQTLIATSIATKHVSGSAYAVL